MIHTLYVSACFYKHNYTRLSVFCRIINGTRINYVPKLFNSFHFLLIPFLLVSCSCSIRFPPSDCISICPHCNEIYFLSLFSIPFFPLLSSHCVHIQPAAYPVNAGNKTQDREADHWSLLRTWRYLFNLNR